MALSLPASASTCFASGARNIVPSARTRSATPNVSSDGTSGSAKLDLRIVHFIAMLVADMQDIAESFRDQQRRRPAFALDQRVGDDGGGVDHDAVDLARPDLGRLHHIGHAGEETLQQVVMGGQHLVDGENAR